jgi:guanyl-specific ribonuclease Sa
VVALSSLPAQAYDTVDLIDQGEPFPHYSSFQLIDLNS